MDKLFKVLSTVSILEESFKELFIFSLFGLPSDKASVIDLLPISLSSSLEVVVLE